ncbi:Copper chaperone domain-containing protein [Dioscorea alata]|uniref:Copper chaperone domain-containing protein n=1 Tax=Dioscorea alata TaxID=55571 RepID=A0ACB7W6V9_DIOAL|nr:Copper chaperone domain-containing protein [Dioscorea alata]
MGEEEKPKAEEPKKEEEKPKAEETKKEASNGAEAKADEAAAEAAPPPPPPEEIVMRVFMHCEGCARKVRRCLKGFDGVEEVKTDCKSHKVVVKGKKAAEDPLKVVERVQKKSGRKVELLTPLPPPKSEKKEEEKKEEETPKPEEKKEEPVVIAVVLKVFMHCEACAQEIKKRILKMKGVQSAEPDLKSSQVTVKGVFDPQKLSEYVYKRTGKHTVIIKQDPAEKPTEANPKDEKKSDAADTKDTAEKKDDAAAAKAAEDKNKDESGAAAADAAGEETKVVELKRNEFLYYYPRHYPVEHAYPPQIFSDENPNACVVM